MILLRVQKSNRHYLVNIRKTDFGKFRGYSKNHQFWHSKWWQLFLSAADLVWTDDHYDCLVVQQKLMLIDIPSRAGSHIPTGRTKIIDSQVAKLLPKLMGSVSSHFKVYFTLVSHPPFFSRAMDPYNPIESWLFNIQGIVGCTPTNVPLWEIPI